MTAPRLTYGITQNATKQDDLSLAAENADQAPTRRPASSGLPRLQGDERSR